MVKRGVGVIYGLLIAVAVSMDSLGVGIAYGLRGIRLPFTSYLAIGVCTGLLVSVSMFSGRFIRSILPSGAESLGGLILVLIGLWQLYQGWQTYLHTLAQEEPGNSTVLSLRLPSLGIIIQIIRDPLKADFNRSGVIDFKESLALGAALGLDAFGAGLGAAVAGFSFFLIPVVSFTCVVFVSIGLTLGQISANNWFARKVFALPGLILVILGLLKF